MSRTAIATEYKQENLRLAAKYNFIVNPISYHVLWKVLTAQNYQMAGPGQDSAVLSFTGIIGRKGIVTADVQTEGQVVGINSINTNSLISAFDELEEDLSEERGERLSTKARFYEAIVQFDVKTSKNPLRVMAHLARKYPYCKEISEIIGEKVVPLGIRYSPAETSIESENWLDFRIEPMLNKAGSSYLVYLVFRRRERLKVIEQIRNSREIAIQCLKLIELNKS
jgi:hypothetical protein